MKDITEGINKVLMGPQKKSRLVTEKDRNITAYHESGHAILGKLLKNCDNVQEVSIIPRGMAGGYTMQRPDDDDSFVFYSKLMDDIAMSMGGRIAEELVFKDITTGASSDIQHASKIAHKMVFDWGMSKTLGFLSLSSQQEIFVGRDYQMKNDFSEKLAAQADEEVKSILAENYARAKKILLANRDKLDEMAKLLLERETIYTAEVDMIMDGKKADEIIKIMQKQEKEQKEKEKKLRQKQLAQKMLDDYRVKIEEGKKLMENGIITMDEYTEIVKEYEDHIGKIEAESKKTEKVEEAKETNKIETKQTEKLEEKKPKRVKVTTTKKTTKEKKEGEDK